MGTTPIGAEGAFYLADSAGTMRDLTSFLTKIDADFSRATLVRTTMGNAGVRRRAGLQEHKISIAGEFDSAGTGTPDQWLHGLLHAAGSAVPASFVYAAGGSASALPYTAGTVLINDYKTSGPVDDVVTFTADFDGDGVVTRGTF